MGEEGGVEVLKQENKELRYWALSAFDSTGELFGGRVGIEEEDLRRGFTMRVNWGGSEK